MQRPTRSRSNLSISEFKSATDLEIESYFPASRSVLADSPWSFQRSPLIDKNFEVVNRNTMLHCTQSSPSLTTPTHDNEVPRPNISKGKTTKKGRKKNAVLDEISMDFCQDFSQVGVTEGPSPNPEAGSANTSDTGKRAKPKILTTRGKKKAEEMKKTIESIENIPANSLPKNLKPQNDLLESMRVMINKTVVEAVETSSNTVREEINSLRTSFNNQIKSLSEKETRHHVESSLNVRGELEKISNKLTGLEELKVQFETSTQTIKNKLEKMEAVQLLASTDTDERISTLEITEDTHFKLLCQGWNDLEMRMQANDEKTQTMGDRISSWDERLEELEAAMKKAVDDCDMVKQNMKTMGSTPADYAQLTKDIEMKRTSLIELSTTAEKLMDKMKDGMVEKNEFERVRSVGAENTNRLDRMQKEDKMLNLLFANLPANLHNIHGFANFAYNELNVELAPGDVMFVSKVFESANRLVHLIRFRSLEVRNAVYRGRTNLGFRSKIWVNEDLIPSKEALALGARRRFRAGKIARNWTFQGEVYISLKNDPTPIKISSEDDFPKSTALKEGEGMLPKEIPLRNRGLQSYQRGQRNESQRENQRPSQDIRNSIYAPAGNQTLRGGNAGAQNSLLQNNVAQQQLPNNYGHQQNQGQAQQNDIQPTAPFQENRQLDQNQINNPYPNQRQW